MLDLCGSKGELGGQVAVAAAELRVAGDESVVLGRAVPRGSGGGSMAGDLLGERVCAMFTLKW